ncbi:hypothetical protein CEUSTIGMA_g1736.t1 [Chlamydomonas eustigma]|uniref:SGNH hydrolase-type esterase domain-containing protein n=1 Tax=Chlamydomonas eustigma TaxID=1157962 RepID=A0A250WTX8_9CHLO|nr:hypothetical protein CEUSTIGMA_g1736.t1 [Chlamydomonas eustigma]|eukprot:GAX74287.1 hypothetical protein CEUSTIGMA_g1736.t1 [Chlamydomonas eustigma]
MAVASFKLHFMYIVNAIFIFAFLNKASSIVPLRNEGYFATSNSYSSSREVMSSQSYCRDSVYSEPVPNFQWMSDEETRQRSQTSPGNTARLRAAVDRYMKGDNLTVVFLGGSITAGQGAVDGKAFPFWAEEILQGSMGNRVRVHNGAVPGTLSAYMSVCHNVHAPREAADIVFIDYSINDPTDSFPAMDNMMRRPFERLLRKLLNYPRRPAVILIHAYRWISVDGVKTYWKSCERDFHDFGIYYGLPELSVKAGAYELMLQGIPGFIVNRTRADHNGRIQQAIDSTLKGNVFYWDIIHPDGQTGHKFMGEIAAQAVLDAWSSVKASSCTEKELLSVKKPLLPPLLSNNYESASDRCFIGPVFVKAVISNESWVYKDEGSSARPKLGFISEKPHAQLKIKVNTTSSTGMKEKEVTVEISYLKSYVNMGMARVECISGCICLGTKMDGHTTDKTSLLNLHEFKASQHEECVMAITILEETSSGKHKVKIAGITISEEGGGEGIKNNMAIDMVMEGVSKEGSSTAEFDMKTWGRLHKV